MDETSASARHPTPDDDSFASAECARFEARSVTGASYTIVEHRHPGDSSGATEAGTQKAYHTAYAGLPVVANDDGSFTIVTTHTRLVRVDHC